MQRAYEELNYSKPLCTTSDTSFIPDIWNCIDYIMGSAFKFTEWMRLMNTIRECSISVKFQMKLFYHCSWCSSSCEWVCCQVEWRGSADVMLVLSSRVKVVCGRDARVTLYGADPPLIACSTSHYSQIKMNRQENIRDALTILPRTASKLLIKIFMLIKNFSRTWFN